MRRLLSCAALVSIVGACLFPSLGGDVGDAARSDSSSAADADASAQGCPATSDPSLEAYYKLDEGTGTSVTDCSPHHRDGTLITPAAANASWTTSGKIGGALVVSSNAAGTGCVDIKGFPELAGALTVTAWMSVSVDPFVNLPGFAVSKTLNATEEGWRLSNNTGHVFAFTLGDGDAGLYQVNSNATTPLEQWAHVAGVFAPNADFLVYVNGAIHNSKTPVLPAVLPSKANLRLGCRGDNAPTSYYNGILDEVRIYSRALSASEIAALANP